MQNIAIYSLIAIDLKEVRGQKKEYHFHTSNKV